MKRGFLLMNTGAPDAPTEDALNIYLKDFLTDPRMTNVPKLLRAPLVNWVILPQQLEEMVAAYASIWTDDGCPPVQYTRKLAQQLSQRLNMPVAAGMAHGNPSYKSAIEQLLGQGVDEICLLWMFPQHDISKQDCVEHIKKELKHLNSSPTLRVAPAFHDEPAFIDPLAERLQGTDDYVLFNYHGLSTHSLKQSDPTHHHCLTAQTCCQEGSLAHDTCYRFQCFSTSRSIAQAAGIPQSRYSTSYQTRHKQGKWLQPHTEDVLKKLPANGHKRVTVLCPAFLCDGLETLEEIGLRGKYLFKEAGGDSFRMIPCLNDSPAALHCLETLMSKADSWTIEWIPKQSTEAISA